MRKWFAPQNAGTFHCNGASAVGVFGADERGVGVLCANGLAKFRSANATPAPIIETAPPSPGPDYAWVDGDWVWNGGWVWVVGHWDLPPFPNGVWR